MNSAWRRAMQFSFVMALWTALLFLGARRIDWMRGWFSVGLYLFAMIAITIVMHRSNPGLMAERAKWRRKDTKPFDRAMLPLVMLSATAQPFVAGREAGCPTCTPLPLAWLYPGTILFLLGSAIVAWVMAVNRHAETTVRIQTDRDHTVVTDGPYRVVRHPMYVGSILMYAGLPMIWGAARWAAALSAFQSVLFVWRTVLEDRTLRRELDGYEAFARNTRYRLIPGVW